MCEVYFDDILILKAKNISDAVVLETAWERKFKIYGTRCRWDGEKYLNYSDGKYNLEFIKSRSLVKTKG